MTHNLKDLGYDKFKTVCLNEDPEVLKVRLSEIQLVDKDTLSVQGNLIPSSSSVTGNLVDLLGIPKGFLGDYLKYFKTEEEAFVNFLKTIKISKEDKEVYLIAKNNKVVGISEKYIPNEIYFKILEDVMNKRPFDIKDGYSTDGNIHITATNKHGEFCIAGLSKENFLPGFSLKNNTKGMELNSFLYRLICSNGMVTSSNESTIKYTNDNDFYNALNRNVIDNFLPLTFEQRVMRAIKTMASYKEIEQVKHLIRFSNKSITAEFAERFAPTFDIDQKLKKANIDLRFLSEKQKATIPSSISVWDSINNLTDFASHEFYDIEVSPSNRFHLQKEAGEILTKKAFDIENIIIL